MCTVYNFYAYTLRFRCLPRPWRARAWRARRLKKGRHWRRRRTPVGYLKVASGSFFRGPGGSPGMAAPSSRPGWPDTVAHRRPGRQCRVVRFISRSSHMTRPARQGPPCRADLVLIRSGSGSVLAAGRLQRSRASEALWCTGRSDSRGGWGSCY